MIRRSTSTLTTLLGMGVAAILVAGCASAVSTPASTALPTAGRSAAHSASTSASAAPSASPIASPTPSPSLGLPHVNAALEDKLPDYIGGIQLQKLSLPLSTYIASLKGKGDGVLYTPWLVKFGKTPDGIDIAAASDLLSTVTFHVSAIQVAGVAAADLSDGFAAVAKKAAWPVATKHVGPKTVLEIVDPETTAAGKLGIAYIYAYDDILYVVVTNDPALLLEAMIKLPPVPAS